MNTGSFRIRSRASTSQDVDDAASRARPATPSWKQQLAAAKTAWDRLSVIELLRSGGREQALVDLVEDRYAVTRVEADRQVQRFLHRPLG